MSSEGSTVYRAYSPTQGSAPGVTLNRQQAVGWVGVRNQGCATTGEPPDWGVQAGHVIWNVQRPRYPAHLEALVEAEEFMGGPASI